MIRPCDLCGDKAEKPTLVCSACAGLAEDAITVPPKQSPRTLKDALIQGSDPVNHPAHYLRGGLEAIDVIEAFASDNYLRASALKYLLRAGAKGDLVEDLRKAEFFLKREIVKERGKAGVP